MPAQIHDASACTFGLALATSCHCWDIWQKKNRFRMRFTGNVLDDGALTFWLFGPFSSPSTCNWMDMESTTSQTWWNVMMISTHRTSGCRLKRSVARRKTMGWPPNAIQSSETCRLVSAGWWDDKFLKWPCTFRRIGVQNRCFTSDGGHSWSKEHPKNCEPFRYTTDYRQYFWHVFQPTFTMVFSAFLMFHNVTPSSDPPWPSPTCIQ